MSVFELAPIGAPTSALTGLWLIPALPLVGAAVNLVAGKRLGKLAGMLATALVAAAFVLSLSLIHI